MLCPEPRGPDISAILLPPGRPGTLRALWPENIWSVNRAKKKEPDRQKEFKTSQALDGILQDQSRLNEANTNNEPMTLVPIKVKNVT